MSAADTDSGGDPKAAIAWLRAHRDELARVPAPAGGSTLERWRHLAGIARSDLALARLAEGHLDARAILVELGRPELVHAGCWGVWAAEPGRVRAEPSPGGWRLMGEKRWCSGSVGLDNALVTATAPDGPRLFLVETAAVHAVPGSWNPTGMVATASETIAFDGVVGAKAAIGGPGAYVGRPGFWIGSMGVAACWFGGAVGVADLLAMRVSRTGDAHETAVLGRVRSRLDASADRLAAAASWLDERARDPRELQRRALSLRLTVEESARAVLEDVTLIGGSSALAFERDHARRVVDLTLYLRQLDRHRAEGELGADSCGRWEW